MIARRALLATALVAPAMAQAAPPRWLTLPPTPALPPGGEVGIAPVNGVKIWFASYGNPANPTVVLLHGGLANSNYWGNQIPPLAEQYHVVVMDSRGHGRSTRDAQGYSYGLMARDVVGLLDHMSVQQAAIVGWSDGAIIGLDLAINHRARVSRVFSFAANTDPSGVQPNLDKHPVFGAFIARAGEEYRQLSPTPNDYQAFLKAISTMWDTEPHYGTAQLYGIATAVLVADGDHDEAIKRPHTERIAAQIPGAGLLIQPNVSHFSMLQDPPQFTEDVRRFLANG
jgi:pimeloyl-ACP methyl ester carboxylesterase